MAFQITGKLYRIFDTEQKTDSFKAREFVIETEDSQYPQVIKFQLTQDRCTLIDEYSEGDQLLVHFDLRGREWNERFFTNLNAWRIERADESTTTQQGDGSPQATSAGNSQPAGQAEFDDDIPF